MLPDIRDQLTLGELAHLPPSMAFPVKYLRLSRPTQELLIEINP